MAKMSDRVPNKRLGTGRLSHVFLKINPYDPNSKFGSDLTFMQSKIKICRKVFSQTKKNVKSEIAQNLSYSISLDRKEI